LASDPFSTLGLPARFDLDLGQIEARWRELNKALHPDKHVGKLAHERRIALAKAVEVNEAYRVLRDDLTRAEALLALRGDPVPEKQPGDPAFWMEIMERREALREARTARDAARVRQLAGEVRVLLRETCARLAAQFADHASADVIAETIGRMRCYRRLLDEVEIFEEEVLAGAAP
jgi:molecular chaperone HscB